MQGVTVDSDQTGWGAQVVSEAISADGSFRMMEVCSFAMSLQPSSLCLHARSSA